MKTDSLNQTHPATERTPTENQPHGQYNPRGSYIKPNTVDPTENQTNTHHNLSHSYSAIEACIARLQQELYTLQNQVVSIQEENNGSLTNINQHYGKTTHINALFENDYSYLLTIELPGICPASLDISIIHGVIHVAGKKSQQQAEPWKPVVSNTTYGNFQYQFCISPNGQNLNPQSLRCQFNNGVLTVEVSKTTMEYTVG